MLRPIKSGELSPIKNSSTKFEINRISSMLANTIKLLNKPEAMKQREFGGTRPKIHKH